MRIVRHWKQKFDEDAALIFIKRVQLDGSVAMPGDTVPEDLRSQRHRMKVWWRAGFVALKDWDYENGVPAEEPSYEDRGGGWYVFADGTKVHGKRALEAKLAEVG